MGAKKMIFMATAVVSGAATTNATSQEFTMGDLDIDRILQMEGDEEIITLLSGSDECQKVFTKLDTIY